MHKAEGSSDDRSTSDLAKRVAQSFGGAVEDKFIQARLPKIHRRVLKAYESPSKPRRGFDALVEALLPMVKTTEEAALEREIAQAIGADINDRVVHNLAVRIRALRNNE
jgi:hypothetical protein